ncbi:MAG: N-acetylmuramoyl-L-alanine amidase [Gammaproteobacteria bacterium]
MSAKHCLLGWVALVAGGLVNAAQVQVQAVCIAAGNDNTRIALDLSRPAEHKLFTLSNPHRVVIDIKPGRIAAGALPLPGGRGSVQRIRSANRQDGTVRIVLDLTRPVKPRSFLLASDGRRGDRLVVDLAPVGAPPRIRKAPLQQADSGAGRHIVVAVDAGHGGKDPGARGPNGVREKDVVLKISRRLAEIIDADPGMRAYLTRSSDKFVNLRERMERSRSVAADLFISIHADAFSDRRVRGATVYVLSSQGASDEAALRLAARENAAVLIGGVHLDDKEPTLAEVLLDLSQNASLSASIDVGDEILHQISRITKIRKPRVQQAPFLVLKSPDVPSVLIETAFISNPGDEKNLASVRYRERLAQAIFAGISDYFAVNAPPGTLLAQSQRKPRSRIVEVEHVIRRGETLSAIASRYDVSVRRIRSVNKLRGDKIIVGRILRIPSAQDI